jgi:hypothetical protein
MQPEARAYRSGPGMSQRNAVTNAAATAYADASRKPVNAPSGYIKDDILQFI